MFPALLLYCNIMLHEVVVIFDIAATNLPVDTFIKSDNS